MRYSHPRQIQMKNMKFRWADDITLTLNCRSDRAFLFVSFLLNYLSVMLKYFGINNIVGYITTNIVGVHSQETLTATKRQKKFTRPTKDGPSISFFFFFFSLPDIITLNLRGLLIIVV